ncbi:MAG TPA: anthranilate phosphoribosyltransferase [Terriglobia bacterium]|nr:anthranilate phosphoribosyltransferase [Terriglobia bacterium]
MALRRQLPTFGAQRLKREWDFPLSQVAIHRIWRQHDRLPRRCHLLRLSTRAHPPGAHAYQSDVETVHRLIEDEFFVLESFRHHADFMAKAALYQLYFNLARPNSHKEYRTPWEIFHQLHPQLPLDTCLLPPLFLDYRLNTKGRYDVPLYPYALARHGMYLDQAIEKLNAGFDLTRQEAGQLSEELFSGNVPDDEIVALLVALRTKGEKADELVGFAQVMRARAAETLREAGVDLDEIKKGGPLLDTCGTGGDGQCTFNVSTAAALVAAAAGVRVAKHGNRSISSRCGSADVLEALGVAIDLPLNHIPGCLERAGMVFLFAPHLHLATRHVMNARRSLKTKTVFNLLGPLTNPLGASVQLVGIYDRTRTEMYAQACAAVGTRRAFVVAGHDGVDEISTVGATQVSELNDGEVQTRDVYPEDFGLARAPAHALKGGDAPANADILRRLLDGERGPYRDVVLANSSAALVAAGKARNFLEGVERGAEALDTSAARQTLATLVGFTQSVKH